MEPLSPAAPTPSPGVLPVTGLGATTTRRRVPPLPVTVLVVVVCYLGSNMPTALYGLLRAELGFSLGTQTAIFTAYVVGMLPSLLISGPLSDRVGRRVVLAGGVSLSIAGCLVFAFAGDVTLMLLARLLQGLGIGAVSTAGASAIVESLPGARSRTAALLATVAPAAGAALGPVFGGALAEALPRPTSSTFLIQVVALVAVGCLLPLRTAPATGVAALPAPAPDADGPLPSLGAVSALASLSWSMVGVFQSVGPSLLSEALDVESLVALGAVVGLLLVVSIVAQGLLGGLADDTLAVIGLIGLAVGAGLFVLTLYRGEDWLAIAVSVFGGAGHGLAFLAATRKVTRIARHTPPDRIGRLMARHYTVAYAGLAVPTLTLGLLSTWVDATHAAAALLAVIVVGALALLTTYRPQRAGQDRRKGRIA